MQVDFFCSLQKSRFYFKEMLQTELDFHFWNKSGWTLTHRKHMRFTWLKFCLNLPTFLIPSFQGNSKPSDDWEAKDKVIMPEISLHLQHKPGAPSRAFVLLCTFWKGKETKEIELKISFLQTLMDGHDTSQSPLYTAWKDSTFWAL